MNMIYIFLPFNAESILIKSCMDETVNHQVQTLFLKQLSSTIHIFAYNFDWGRFGYVYYFSRRRGCIKSILTLFGTVSSLGIEARTTT